MLEHERRGILAGGNWIVDYVKIIDTYPAENALANILSQGTGNGGAPCNVLKALRRLGADFPLEGIGAVGADENGAGILRECREMGIDTRQLKVLEGVDTSYTDVMTVATSGKRTFFHRRGANACLDVPDFDFSGSAARIFHLGYLLLLDKLDEMGPEGLSGAARVLRQAGASGMMTSADIVSEQSDRYRSIVPSALPFVDFLFLNELEAAGLTGIGLTEAGGRIHIREAQRAAELILQMGVRRWVIIHFPEGALAGSKSGEVIFQPGLVVPQELIRGSVGAGDAFAAGVLAGIHEGWPMKRSLESGVCVAAASLFHPGASEGIEAWEECLSLGGRLGFRPMPPEGSLTRI